MRSNQCSHNKRRALRSKLTDLGTVTPARLHLELRTPCLCIKQAGINERIGDKMTQTRGYALEPANRQVMSIQSLQVLDGGGEG